MSPDRPNGKSPPHRQPLQLRFSRILWLQPTAHSSMQRQFSLVLGQPARQSAATRPDVLPALKPGSGWRTESEATFGSTAPGDHPASPHSFNRDGLAQFTSAQ